MQAQAFGEGEGDLLCGMACLGRATTEGRVLAGVSG